MKNKLKSLLKFKTTKALFIITGLSLVLLITRMSIANSIRFRFLLWNLFLAFIPWSISCISYIWSNRNKITAGILFFLWLVFFPNAPYLLTDMIHLSSDPRVPVLLDFMLLSCFGIGGLLYGFASLLIIETVLSEKIKPRKAAAVSIFTIYLSALGIYLGRVLRWNSWDLFTNPGSVIGDTFRLLFLSGDRKRIWFIVIITGTLLSILYLLFRKAGRKDFAVVSGGKTPGALCLKQG